MGQFKKKRETEHPETLEKFKSLVNLAEKIDIFQRRIAEFLAKINLMMKILTKGLKVLLCNGFNMLR